MNMLDFRRMYGIKDFRFTESFLIDLCNAMGDGHRNPELFSALCNLISLFPGKDKDIKELSAV